MAHDDPWKAQLRSLGEFIRNQRQMSRLTLRELADLTHVSNAYLSQIERGLHEPSVRVMKAIADALQMSAESLLAQAGVIKDDSATVDTEKVIKADPRLSAGQKKAMLEVYRSYVAANE